MPARRSATPDVAVVIPTARRETRLAFALEALARQTLPRDRFEVVVVRGDEPGPTVIAPAGLPVRFMSVARDAGPAAKRNLGWRATSAPLIAFTDDDCRPAPDWLERLLEAAAREHGDFVLQGRTDADPDEQQRLHGLAVTQRIPALSGWYETCNIAYPRALLERLEGFDEEFAGPDGGSYPIGGEDTDLGLRERIAEDGDLRRFVNVYVGGEDIRFLDGLETAVEDGDEVTILPAVAGGS